jgi:hypothetical protein
MCLLHWLSPLSYLLCIDIPPGINTNLALTMYLCLSCITTVPCVQEKFGKSFDELEPHDRQKVGGTVGGELRGGQLAHPERAPEPPKVKFGEDNN